MKTVTISVEKLYGKNLEGGIVEKTGNEDMTYYDLYINGTLACMDGETCEVVEESENRCILINKNGDADVKFTLTTEEMKLCAV